MQPYEYSITFSVSENTRINSSAFLFIMNLIEHRVQNNKTKNEIEVIILIPPHPSPKNKYLHTKIFFRTHFSSVGDCNMSTQGQRNFKATSGSALCMVHKVSGLPGRVQHSCFHHNKGSKTQMPGDEKALRLSSGNLMIWFNCLLPNDSTSENLS